MSVIGTVLPGGTHAAIGLGCYAHSSSDAGQLAALRAFWEFDTAELLEVEPSPAEAC